MNWQTFGDLEIDMTELQAVYKKNTQEPGSFFYIIVVDGVIYDVYDRTMDEFLEWWKSNSKKWMESTPSSTPSRKTKKKK